MYDYFQVIMILFAGVIAGWTFAVIFLAFSADRL